MNNEYNEYVFYSKSLDEFYTIKNFYDNSCIGNGKIKFRSNQKPKDYKKKKKAKRRMSNKSKRK